MGETEISTMQETEITPPVATETGSKIEMSTETGAATAVYLPAWHENPARILPRLASETASPAVSLGP
jgi:hypothetical protein